jgi:uncharacterized protein
MVVTFDAAKRARTLRERALDFADAEKVLSGRRFTREDERQDYGEKRYITVGLLAGRMVVVVWTPRGEARHVISMRKANEREKKRYEKNLG